MLKSGRKVVKPGILAALIALIALIVALSSGLSAHDIPNDVTVQAFLKPAGQQLHLLVRVPLRAMVDVEFPERGPNRALDLSRIDASLRDAATLWLSNDIDLYEGDRLLGKPEIAATRVSLLSDKSFTSYEEALANINGPRLPDDTELFWGQGMLDVLFEYPIDSEQSNFSIRPRLGRLGLQTLTVLRFLPPGGAVRAFELYGNPELVRLDPRWRQAALHFVKMGFLHILDGADHLLFLFCLVIPFRRFGGLIPIVTSFTVAHSITLLASAYNLGPDALWFPPLIEVLIAASIVYMALENIVGTNVRRRWMITFGFGLVHGFGFSFALGHTLQFAGSHLLTSLLSFNVGVELGQLLVLMLLIPALEVLFRLGVAERIGTIILSGLVAHTGWHWMTERAAELSQFPFEWPVLTAALLASVMNWLIVVLIFVGLIWLASEVFRRHARRTAEVEAPVTAGESKTPQS